jgi:hypothetical protein
MGFIKLWYTASLELYSQATCECAAYVQMVRELLRYTPAVLSSNIRRVSRFIQSSKFNHNFTGNQSLDFIDQKSVRTSK